MKRIVIISYAVAALCVASCQRETSSTETVTTGTAGTTAADTTVTAEPRDLTKARINTVVAPDTGQYVLNARIGAAIGKDGVVEEEKTEFAAGEDVVLSLWLKESPPNLQTSAKIEDEAGKQVDIELRPMKGEKIVSFTLGDKKLKPGKYKVTGFWGGNVAAEYDITVTAARPAKSPSKKAS